MKRKVNTDSFDKNVIHMTMEDFDIRQKTSLCVKIACCNKTKNRVPPQMSLFGFYMKWVSYGSVL